MISRYERANLLQNFMPGARFSKRFGSISRPIISYVSQKTKRFPGMKFCNKFTLSYLVIIVKGQLFRISGSQFLKWLFGPEKFSGLSRNGPQDRNDHDFIILISSFSRKRGWLKKVPVVSLLFVGNVQTRRGITIKFGGILKVSYRVCYGVTYDNDNKNNVLYP